MSRLAEALRDAAVHLTPNVGRFDHPPEIVYRGVADDADPARFRIDLDLAGVTTIRTRFTLRICSLPPAPLRCLRRPG